MMFIILSSVKSIIEINMALLKRDAIAILAMEEMKLLVDALKVDALIISIGIKRMLLLLY